MLLGAIGRYIFRTTFGAFLIVLVSLTAVIWITHALRDIDLITAQGQTILVFLGITALVIPKLAQVIAPVALVIAVAHVLNKLASDSEIIVLNAAGASPWRLFNALAAVAVIVAILVGVTSFYVAPKCQRELRRMVAEIRADVVANIVQPGRFTSLEQGLTFHIRERRPDGRLFGIFVDDRRNPKEQITVLAEAGEIVQNHSGTFLILSDGSVQRRQAEQRDPAIVTFERYAFDLSRFATSPFVSHQSLGERYIWQLLAADPKDPIASKEPGRIRAELHDRISAPLYPLAFMIITHAYLGAPTTTRQSRRMAILSTISSVAALRLIGFASVVFAIKSPWAPLLQYGAILSVFVLGLAAIARGSAVEPPAFIADRITSIMRLLTRRFALP